MLIALFSMSATKCAGDDPEFKWNPDIYATDSRTGQIFRREVFIKTSEPLFDKFICTQADEIPKAKQAVFDLINQCEKWKPNTNIEKIKQEISEVQ